MKNKQFTMPDASIILLCVAFIAYLATLFITPGVFNSAAGSHTVQLSQYQAVATEQSPPPFCRRGRDWLSEYTV
jgi:uncharacterized ion transporter superfamily protein YfcC